MPKPSPQLVLSAAACGFAMAAFALAAPAIEGRSAGAVSAVPVIAGAELPSPPALSDLIRR